MLENGNFLLVFFKRSVYNASEVINMTSEQMLKMAVGYSNTNMSEVARRLGTTPQNLSQKIKRNTLTKEDMEKIAEAIGGKYVAYFEFPDGTKI